MAAMWTSKLGNRFPKDEVERRDLEHHRILDRLRKEPCNATCAECGDPGTSWASVNLGVFLCIRCADVHRALGTHISKVKGCTGTYLWGPDEVAQMQCMGNAVAEAKFGGTCSAARPASTASKEERVELCRKKYEKLIWAPVSACSGSRVELPSMYAETSSSSRVSTPRSKGPAHGVSRLAEGRPEAQQTVAAWQKLPAPARGAVLAPEDVDWDALFADVDAPPPETPSSGPCKTQESSPPVEVASLDDFLGRCLSGPEPAISTELAQMPYLVPAAGTLHRASSDFIWSNFGAW